MDQFEVPAHTDHVRRKRTTPEGNFSDVTSAIASKSYDCKLAVAYGVKAAANSYHRECVGAGAEH